MVKSTSLPSVQNGLLYQSRRLPNPLLPYAYLNAPLANSTLLVNPLQIDLEPSAADIPIPSELSEADGRTPRICSTAASVTSRTESPQRLALIPEADVETAFGDLVNQMPDNLPIVYR